MCSTLSSRNIEILSTVAAMIAAFAYAQAAEFPNATNTGVPAGTELTIVKGNQHSRRPGKLLAVLMSTAKSSSTRTMLR